MFGQNSHLLRFLKVDVRNSFVELVRCFRLKHFIHPSNDISVNTQNLNQKISFVFSIHHDFHQIRIPSRTQYHFRSKNFIAIYFYSNCNFGHRFWSQIGHIWYYLVIFGHIWSYILISSLMKFGRKFFRKKKYIFPKRDGGVKGCS